jgi:ABC-type Fe3+-siderophore transport system permease subunit
VVEGRYEMLYLSLAVTALACLAADRFTVAGLGESFATNLGLNYKALVWQGLVVVALVTSAVVVTAGSLPFVGLIVPNVVRLVLGDNVRRSVLWVALIGAGLTLLCDLVGRLLIAPYEIPVGTVLGVLGSALFLAHPAAPRKDRAEQPAAIPLPWRQARACGAGWAPGRGWGCWPCWRCWPDRVHDRGCGGRLGLRAAAPGAKVAAMVVVACALGMSTVVFQTVSHNTILTPSVMGLDALYQLLQAAWCWCWAVGVVAHGHGALSGWRLSAWWCSACCWCAGCLPARPAACT